ncbi:MAG: hypothetical protein ACPLVI_08375, partial [Thermoplasmata archaeon]
MSKYSNKKALISTIVAMLMVLSAFLVITGSASATASGTVTYNPSTFGLTSYSSTTGTGSTVPTIVVANGGNFGSGSTVYFYISQNMSSSGIVFSAYGPVAQYNLQGGQTTLTNAIVPFFFNATTTLSGIKAFTTYYILASDAKFTTSPPPNYAQFSSPTPIVFTNVQPTLSIAPSPQVVGGTVKITGNYFDAGASITVYVGYAGSNVVLATATANAVGAFKVYATIPTISGTVNTSGARLAPAYYAVAQETNAYSSSYPKGGVTAFTTFDVAPSITVSPASTQGLAGSTFTITGSGFVSGQVITGYSSTSTGTSSITIAGVNTYFSTVTVASDGTFTVTVTLASKLTGVYGGVSVVITPINPRTTDTFPDAVFVSIPYVSPTLMLLDLSTGSTIQGNVSEQLLITVYGFPASSSVNVYFDSSIITFTTDSNGFAQYETTIPAIPGYTYNVFATSNGVSASATFTVLEQAYVTMSNGNLLNGQYAAAGSVVTININGAYPYQSFDFNDTGLYNYTGSSLFWSYYYYGVPSITVTNGTIGKYSFEANGNGVLTLSYPLLYS